MAAAGGEGGREEEGGVDELTADARHRSGGGVAAVRERPDASGIDSG